MADVSNARPLAIFTGYMVTAAALTATSIAVIRSGASKRQNALSQSRRVAFTIFSVFAAVSLATTWYHMFCFFQWSYQEWAKDRSLDDADTLHLGEWLRDTTLFKQAWASTLETPQRAWWCLQIFGFCANWSVMLAAQEKKRNIPHLWIFMLLGQIVAISFASNMFFLAVLVHEQVMPPKKSGQSKGDRALSDETDSASFWYDRLVAFTIVLAMKVPSTFGEPSFMPLLLAPHLLAFAPLLINRFVAQGPGSSYASQPSTAVRVGSMVLLVAWVTYMVMEQGGDWQTILGTLHEHPAVSSVGWDVVCCWVSYTAWELIGEP